jgi:Domain of unknown function (DUF397)
MITYRPRLSEASWRKSSYSANGANCVEIASNLPGVVAVRDSKDRDGATLVASAEAWSAFVGGIKRAEFDL